MAAIMSIDKIKYVTLVGSRKAPEHILEIASLIGERLRDFGYIRRSGGAPGMDQAWLKYPSPYDEVFRPDNRGINILNQPDHQQYFNLAKTLVPHWNNCGDWARKMHARNTCQVLGLDLNTPSSFLIFWAPEDVNGNVSGGTRTAVELARRHNIPVFNLYKQPVLNYWINKLNIKQNTGLNKFV